MKTAFVLFGKIKSFACFLRINSILFIFPVDLKLHIDVIWNYAWILNHLNRLCAVCSVHTQYAYLYLVKVFNKNSLAASEWCNTENYSVCVIYKTRNSATLPFFFFVHVFVIETLLWHGLLWSSTVEIASSKF